MLNVPDILDFSGLLCRCVIFCFLYISGRTVFRKSYLAGGIECEELVCLCSMSHLKVCSVELLLMTFFCNRKAINFFAVSDSFGDYLLAKNWQYD